MRNEPNWGRGRGTDATDGAKRTQFPRPCRVGRGLGDEGRVRETKPNLGGMGYLGDGASGRPIVQNEPNLAGRLGPRRQKCAERNQSGPAWAGSGPRRAKDAKRTQFPATPGGTRLGGARDEGEMCKTNPIRGDATWGEVPGTRDGGFSLTPDPPASPLPSRSCKTNPIPGGAGWDEACGARGDGAKQSQFPAPAGAVRGHRRGQCFRRSQLCKTNPIWPSLGRVRSPAGERCETNPIWWDQVCKTKPISAPGGRDGSGIRHRIPAAPVRKAPPLLFGECGATW